MSQVLNEAAFDVLFRTARTQNTWLPKPVTAGQLRQVYDLTKWGATSANCFPMRIVFAHSQAERDRLATMVMPGNVEKVATAGAVAIIGYDLKFYDKIPQLFPHAPEAREWFAHDEQVAFMTAFRNGTLQGAYLMLAARALGLDCGPMSGFDAEVVNNTFWPEGRVKANFMCNIGYGDDARVYPRSPRLMFDQACQVV